MGNQTWASASLRFEKSDLIFKSKALAGEFGSATHGFQKFAPFIFAKDVRLMLTNHGLRWRL
jgi:hypothetical protein